MPTKLITGPGEEPVSLSEAKSHLRLETTDHDTLVTSLIISGRIYAEKYTERALITQTWDYFLDEFSSEIEIPLPSLQSVTSVKYIDTAGVLQTLSASTYKVDTVSERGRVVLAYGESWPAVRAEINSVEIRFVAGYVDASSVPEQINDAIKLHIQILFDVPVGDDLKSLEKARDALLDSYLSTRFL